MFGVSVHIPDKTNLATPGHAFSEILAFQRPSKFASRVFMSHSTKVKEFEIKKNCKNNTTNLDVLNFNFNSEQLKAIIIHLDKRICTITPVLAYFDSCPSLKWHPCYHDKKPFFLNKIISKLFSFYILKSPL